MNCERCNARIDYRFFTSCPHCGCEIKRADVPQSNPVSDPLEQPVEPILTWKEEAVNVAHIFVSSISGMISGAVVVYLFVAVTYSALSAGPTTSSSCGWGTVVALFSLVLGGFLGTIGGCVLAVKRPLCAGVRMVRQESLGSIPRTL